jgi:hypothetical protein
MSSHMNRHSRNPTAWAASVIESVAAILLLSSLDPARAADSCKHDQICGLKNPEDMIRVPGSNWAILSRLAKDAKGPGSFSLVDLERRTARPLIPDISARAAAAYADCPGAPDPSELITHGLDVRQQPDGTSELFAVNHGRRQSLEVFDLILSEEVPKLTWKGCVILPSDVSANAVAALTEGVAVTSFGTSDAQGNADMLAGRPAGFVAKWAPYKGWTHVAGSEFGGDNGVAASPDGSTLYVNDWSDGTLRVLSLPDGGAPVIIKLGEFHPDNIHWLPDGNLLIAGQVGKPVDIIDCVRESTCSVGSMIVIVDPKARKVRSHRVVASTSAFAAASTALQYGTDFWLSSFRGDRIIRLGPVATH